MKNRLPAEWEPQDGILLIWPHEKTDWQPNLPKVESVFVEITRIVSLYEKVVIIAPERKQGAVLRKLLDADVAADRIITCEIATNDTWVRDCGPVTVLKEGRPQLLDFSFNGWGLKYACDLDNQLTARLHAGGIFRDTTPLVSLDMVLEGGSIESDGKGTILTTSHCLLNSNRNSSYSKEMIEKKLGDLLGAHHFLWLNNGHLAGDDTDSHIDTLARLCPGDVILYVACADESDEHYSPLQSMALELGGFRTPAGRPYKLVPLPLPEAKTDADGNRLAATYANFLIINGAVLVPVYNDPHDAEALSTIQHVFPDRSVVGIDCSPLILQHGSLHCVSMQLPQGVLR